MYTKERLALALELKGLKQPNVCYDSLAAQSEMANALAEPGLSRNRNTSQHWKGDD